MTIKLKFEGANKQHLKNALESLRKIHFNLSVQNKDETKEETFIFELTRRLEKILAEKD